jgi:integrase
MVKNKEQKSKTQVSLLVLLELPAWKAALRPVSGFLTRILAAVHKHWDLKNPFAKIEPPLHKEPQIRHLLLADIRRLLDYLRARKQGYGSALAFHLANALFQTACRFEELIRLTWSDCQRVGEEIVALRIRGAIVSGPAIVRRASAPPNPPRRAG